MKSKPKGDMVNAPAHYVKGRRFEPIEVIEDWVFDNWNLSNVIKYVSRAGRKGETLEDLRKAAFYLEREIARLSRG